MKIEDILVPIDFSPGSLRALDYALALVDRGGEVYLLHVVDADFLARVSDEGFCDAETARSQMQRKAEERLQKIMRKFSLLNVRLESMVVVGKPFAEILRIAADLVALGSHGYRGFTRFLLGSVSYAVASHAPCSVEIVRKPILREGKNEYRQT